MSVINLCVASADLDGNTYLRNLYQTQIEANNKKELSIDSMDSGFDLYCPTTVILKPKEKILYDLSIKGEPEFAGGYYLYPRSSFGKTPLRLCNSVGIIDNQYRGTYKAWIENTGDSEFTLTKGERYFQLCHPSLIAFKVNLVEEINTNTIRGTGGFGSTGK
jgi:dUTP pyrophosphatase